MSILIAQKKWKRGRCIHFYFRSLLQKMIALERKYGYSVFVPHLERASPRSWLRCHTPLGLANAFQDSEISLL